MTRGVLGLSQKAYIDKVLDRCGMKNCVKGDTLSLLQCPKNDIQKEKMKDISYVLEVESLMYAQVCTCPDIVYTIEKLDKYMTTWDWSLEKFQEGNVIFTEDYMKSDQLQLIGYTDSDYTWCIDSGKSTLGYIFLITRRWWI